MSFKLNFVFFNAKAYSKLHVDSIIEQKPTKMFTDCIDVSQVVHVAKAQVLIYLVTYDQSNDMEGSESATIK